jgi:hypothetical protein
MLKNPNCLFTSALAYYQEEMLKLYAEEKHINPQKHGTKK